MNNISILLAVSAVSFSAFASTTYDAQLRAFGKGVSYLNSGKYKEAEKTLSSIRSPRFYSHEYLFFYRAESVRLQKDVGRKKLSKAADDYLRSLSLTKSKVFKHRLRVQRIKVLRRLARIDIDSGRYYAAMRWINNLDVEGFKDNELLTLYVYSLLKTQQVTAARQLLRRYPKLATKKKIRNLLSKKDRSLAKVEEQYPPWDLGNRTGVHLAWNKSFKKSCRLTGVTKFIQTFEKQPFPAKVKKSAEYFVDCVKKDKSDKVWSEVSNSFEQIPPKVLYHMIDPLWDLNFFEKALKISDYLLDNYPGLQEFSRLYYPSGRISQDLQRYDDAEAYFSKYLSQDPEGSYFETVQFNRALALLRVDRSRGIVKFKDYLKSYPDGRHATGARYIVYRAEDPLGKVKIRDEIQHYYPLSFYSLLINKLENRPIFKEQDFKGKAHPVFKDESLLDLGGHEYITLRKARELEQVNLKMWSGEELKRIAFDKKRPVLMLYLGSWYDRLDVRGQSINYFTRLATSSPKIRRFLDIKKIIPRFYFSELKRKLRSYRLNYKIDPYLVLSLVRQESAFDPKALSSAKAKGLMQLMPKTAENVAKKIGFKDKIDLYDPGTNMLLGTALITRLISQYEGKVYLALAAYNAGPKAVDRWVKARGHLQPVSFVEAIPYKETRFYVLTIMRNYLIYKSIYENQSLQRVEVPWTLKKS